MYTPLTHQKGVFPSVLSGLWGDPEVGPLCLHGLMTVHSDSQVLGVHHRWLWYLTHPGVFTDHQYFQNRGMNGKGFYWDSRLYYVEQCKTTPIFRSKCKLGTITPTPNPSVLKTPQTDATTKKVDSPKNPKITTTTKQKDPTGKEPGNRSPSSENNSEDFYTRKTKKTRRSKKSRFRPHIIRFFF